MEPIKHRIAHYWSHRASSFEEQREREFNSYMKEIWLTEIHRYLPKEKPLNVLDVGTGTGFFAFLLAEEGHSVTGIDLTEDMITGAKRMAERLGLKADFMIMDAEAPAFDSDSFDVIISRNLTWTLPHLGRAYEQWHRLLKPGGVLINFDADYCGRAEECKEESEEELPPNHAHKMVSPSMKQENDAITMEIAAYQNPRPQWDVELMTDLGFERIMIDNGVYKRLYSKKDEFYNPAPVFTIAAYK